MTDPMWFAVQTWPRYEKKAARELKNRGVEVFLPLQRSVHQWSDRRHVVQLPLFPNYVFVRIPGLLDSRVVVLRTTGVIGFVGVRGVGTPVPESEIGAIRRILEKGIDYENCPFLRVGQRVRIRGGSLDGIEGVLVAKNGGQNLLVSINIIQRSLSVRLAGYSLEAA